MPFAKCNCSSCNGHIEFETSNAGQTVNCPHCGQDTVLYVVESTPAELAAPPKRPQPKGPGTTFGLERAVFAVTRAFVLGLSILVVLALALVALTFMLSLAKERKERVVTYEEVSTSLLPSSPPSPGNTAATAPRDVKIPQNVQEVFSKNGDGLGRMLEGIASGEQQAFLNNLSDIIAKARAAGVGASKMSSVLQRYEELWKLKLEKEQARQTERLIARASSLASAFALLIVLTALSMVLVLLAIERNTRPRSQSNC